MSTSLTLTKSRYPWWRLWGGRYSPVEGRYEIKLVNVHRLQEISPRGRKVTSWLTERLAPLHDTSAMIWIERRARPFPNNSPHVALAHTVCIYCLARDLKNNKGVLGRLWLNDDLSTRHPLISSEAFTINEPSEDETWCFKTKIKKIGRTLHGVALDVGQSDMMGRKERAALPVSSRPTEPAKHSRRRRWALKKTIRVPPCAEGEATCGILQMCIGGELPPLPPVSSGIY